MMSWESWGSPFAQGEVLWRVNGWAPLIEEFSPLFKHLALFLRLI